MNRREDFLDPYRSYLGIPFRDEMLPPVIDEMASNNMEINSESVIDVDIPELDTQIDDINTYFDNDGNLITDIINDRFDTDGKQILGEFTFGESGAIAIASDSNNGLWISPTGILAKQSGSTTVTIPVDGSPTFAGSLVAAGGTLGSLRIASGGYIRQGQSSFNSGTGFWLGDDSGTTKFSIGNGTDGLTWNGSTLNIKGVITANSGSSVDWSYLKNVNVVNADIEDATIDKAKIASLDAGDITAGTLTGRTVIARDGGIGANLKLDSNDGRLKWMYNGVTKAFSYANSNGELVIDADNTIFLIADGVNDSIRLFPYNEVYIEGRDFILNLDNNFQFNNLDSQIMNYNSDQDGDVVRWDEQGEVKMQLDDSGDLWVQGSITEANEDFAEMFEATPKYSKKKIPTGTTVVLEEGKIRPARKGEIPFGVISATAGVILGINKQWPKKYLKNDKGETIYEDYEFWSTRKIHKPIPRKKGERDFKNKQQKKTGWSMYEKPPKGAKVKMVRKPKLNPKYNPKKKYIPREKRPEWNVVGLIGKVRIKKGQPVDPRWIKMKEMSKNVDLYLIK